MAGPRSTRYNPRIRRDRSGNEKKGTGSLHASSGCGQRLAKDPRQKPGRNQLAGADVRNHLCGVRPGQRSAKLPNCAATPHNKSLHIKSLVLTRFAGVLATAMVSEGFRRFEIRIRLFL